MTCLGRWPDILREPSELSYRILNLRLDEYAIDARYEPNFRLWGESILISKLFRDSYLSLLSDLRFRFRRLESGSGFLVVILTY